MRKSVFIFATLLILVAQILRADVKCGDKAPYFSLFSADGRRVNLESFKGCYVVLEWFNYNCPFVNKFYENGEMQKWQADAVAKGIVWLVIDSTNPSSPDFMPPKQANTMFARMKMAATALLLDDDGSIGLLYGVTKTPQIFLINSKGIVIYRGAVDDKPTSKAEDIAGAHNYLLAAIDESLAGKAVSKPVTRPYGCSVKYKKGRTPTSDSDNKPKAASVTSTTPYRRGKRVKRAL
jgi:peroxiredoxin